MGREHRLLGALHPTDVRVPRPLVIAGADVLGAPFYVMEFADGVVLPSGRSWRSSTPPRRPRWPTS
jgi:aminoglycoside phosphotransferase (APT) family kinase protein